MIADRPPVPSGLSGHIFYTMQPMQLISWYPRAYWFPKFMDIEKANHVIKIAEQRLAPSGLALKKGETLGSTREIRTSQGTFMSRSEDPDGVLAWIEDKIAVLTGIPAGHGEAFNVLRYENGQHYDSHYDVFMEEEYGKQPNQRVRSINCKEVKGARFYSLRLVGVVKLFQLIECFCLMVAVLRLMPLLPCSIP